MADLRMGKCESPNHPETETAAVELSTCGVCGKNFCATCEGAADDGFPNLCDWCWADRVGEPTAGPEIPS